MLFRSAVLLFAVPRPMLLVFTVDPQVLRTGAALLAIAAAFQLFDGTQAVATGVLRGVGDTRTPMMMNVIGHWVLGLPAGYVLCFWMGWGVSGLWVGLSIGLIFVALALTLVWAQRTRAPRDMHAPGLHPAAQSPRGGDPGLLDLV